MTARIAILGATGYGGAELLRLLLMHPEVEVVWATSRTEAGRAVGEVHPNLLGITELRFSSPTTDEIRASADVVIGALPHGASAEALAPFLEAGMPVIDLSGDFRLRDAGTYRMWYGSEHPRPDLLGRAVYGCPELNREALRKARFVAAPGCFATSINLALLPAAVAGLVAGSPIVVGMTGSSGSGAEPTATTHHPTRAGTLRPYKVLGHQHTPEVLQLLADAGAPAPRIEFTPVSAPLVRGILAVVSMPLSEKALHGHRAEPLDSHDLCDAYEEFFSGHPFVRVLRTREPECGPVATTNYAEVRPRVTSEGRLHAVCALDNLVKGGAGQAVQCLNLMMGWDEMLGLRWPGTTP